MFLCNQTNHSQQYRDTSDNRSQTSLQYSHIKYRTCILLSHLITLICLLIINLHVHIIFFENIHVCKQANLTDAIHYDNHITLLSNPSDITLDLTYPATPLNAIGAIISNTTCTWYCSQGHTFHYPYTSRPLY